MRNRSFFLFTVTLTMLFVCTETKAMKKENITPVLLGTGSSIIFCAGSSIISKLLWSDKQNNNDTKLLNRVEQCEKMLKKFACKPSLLKRMERCEKTIEELMKEKQPLIEHVKKYEELSMHDFIPNPTKKDTKKIEKRLKKNARIAQENIQMIIKNTKNFHPYLQKILKYQKELKRFTKDTKQEQQKIMQNLLKRVKYLESVLEVQTSSKK